MLTLYDQTTYSDKALGTHGDCVRACHQTLLQNPLEGFPHPIYDGGMSADYFLALERMGYVERFIRARPGRDMRHVPRVVLAAGPTVRTPVTGVNHGVVYDRIANRLVHDPHPSRAGLTEINWMYWLEKINE
jgi:hypothetical protein